MEIKLVNLKVLVNNISSFFHLSAHEGINSKPVQKYYQRSEDLLKLIKPILDAIVDTEVASDEKLQKIFAGLFHAVGEMREIFDNWQPLMSRIYFVLQAEPLIAKVRTSGLEIFEQLKSLENCIPSELTVASLELCVQKLKHIGSEQTSVTIMEAIKVQVEASGATSESMVKIADSLNLKSNQEILIEAVALEKLKENAEQADKNGEVEYIDQMIALVTHMHEDLILSKQSQSSSHVPIPADFCCPLSLELMTDPVIVASGQTYERAFIRKWIELGLTVCPKTRQTLAHTNLIPNYTVKALIASWSELNNVKLPDLLSLAQSEYAFHVQTHSRANNSTSPDSTRSFDSPRSSLIPFGGVQQEGSRSPPRKTLSLDTALYTMPVICAELLERVLELQNQREELTDRVNHRVMEVATKIREDKPELTRLMRDKEEMERFVGQKRNFEENTTEKLLEMEAALSSANARVERANAELAAVEAGNSDLKREKEALMSSASEIAERLEEVLARGKKNREMIESQEKAKMKYAEDLEAEKRKSLSLKEKLKEAEDVNSQLEDMLIQELKAKEELLLEAGALKKARERKQNERREQ